MNFWGTNTMVKLNFMKIFYKLLKKEYFYGKIRVSFERTLILWPVGEVVQHARLSSSYSRVQTPYRLPIECYLDRNI